MFDDPSNCSWWTGGGFTQAIDGIATLAENGWGTDEPFNTNFYPKTHAVYAQGGDGAWDFIN